MNFIKELKNKKYLDAYSQTKLFEKTRRFAKGVGAKFTYLVLILFYTLQQPSTPRLAKSIIIGALGYFILPMDFIPDFIPVAGFSDDFTALFAALVAVALYVESDTKMKARKRLNIWFGSYNEAQLEIIDKELKFK